MWNIWESLTLHKNLQNHTVSNWCLKPSNSDRELGNYNVHFQQKGCIFKQHQWLSSITFLDPTITDNTFVFLLVKSHLLVQSHPVLWYSPVSLLSVVSKVFEKPVNSRIVITQRNVFFVISSLVLGLLDQLQIFLQLYLIELLELLTSLGLLEL